MGHQEEVKLPSTPTGWAIHLSKLVKLVHDAHGVDRFPIKVADIARDYTRQVYPDAPITLVDGQAFSSKFEGALIPRPGGKEWGIFYNTEIASPGRINFTLGHELGHYLLHRSLSGDPIFCSKSDMWSWDSAYGQMEAQANEFASFLLMPLDDFRDQTSGFNRPSIAMFEPLKVRYGVSVTSAILKWLDSTSARAMIVVSRDGFIDWAWSSKPLLKSGVFFKPRQITTPVPDTSLAGLQDTSSEAINGKMLPEGVWSAHESVFESVIHSEYHGMTISLLVYPKYPHQTLAAYDEPDELEDAFSRMAR